MVLLSTRKACAKLQFVVLQPPVIPTHGRPTGLAVLAEGVEPAADQPHPRDVAGAEGQAAEAVLVPGEGGRTVQVLSP